VAFERSVGPQTAPLCEVERLAGLGLRPRSALAVVEACLKRDDFIEAA
jgi:hypothetical protein